MGSRRARSALQKRRCQIHALDGDRKSTRLNSSHTVIYTLSLHDALPIYSASRMSLTTGKPKNGIPPRSFSASKAPVPNSCSRWRSEEHTSELQSHSDLHSFPTRRSSDLFGFKDVINDWKAEKWDPAALVQRFKSAGAKFMLSM